MLGWALNLGFAGSGAEVTTTPDLSFGVLAIITEDGEGVEGVIEEKGVGVLGEL